MEKISGAQAMEWSIELEMGLRSKKPGQRIDAIKEIGSKLQQWSMEPGMTKAVSDMYGLVAGEDRLFANSIILRLADAFRSGDNSVRSCILKVFLLELRHINKMGMQYDGILSKRRVPNYVELLKRVKAVFDLGDVYAKSLSLRLIGCWADFAKDSTHIRYMILSSLQSSHALEVKASLFAASCFCRLSSDFATIVLEVLIHIISSPQTSFDVKLVAIHILGKMGCSRFVLTRAYKAARDMFPGTLEDKLVAELLISLSKLAIKSTLLITRQVDFLLTFVSHETPLRTKHSALKCLYFLLGRGISQFPVNRNLVAELFRIIDDKDLPLEIHCVAIKILSKMFCGSQPNSNMDKPEVLKLVQDLMNVVPSSVKPNKCLVLDLLVNVLCSFKSERGESLCSFTEKSSLKYFQFKESLQPMASISCEHGLSYVVSHVSSFLMDQIISVVKQMDAGSGEEGSSWSSLSEAKQECQNLIRFILCLVAKHPTSGLVALGWSRYFVELLVSMYERVDLENGNFLGEVSKSDTGAEQSGPTPRMVDSYYKEKLLFISELISSICRVVTSSLMILDKSSALSSEMLHVVKLLVEFLQRSIFCNRHEFFCLSMHFYGFYHRFGTKDGSTYELDKSELSADSCYSHNSYWVGQEWRALEFTKMMIKEGNFWAAYRAAKFCFGEGLWFTAAFTCRKLIGCVQSDPFRSWFRCLVLLAGCESEIKLLLFPKAGIELINGFQKETVSAKPLSCVERATGGCAKGSTNLHDFEGKLVKVYSRIRASEEILAACGGSYGSYDFQRWFLSLRAKVLEVLVDMLGLLSSHKFPVEDSKIIVEGNFEMHLTTLTQSMHSMAHDFAIKSFQLKRLANYYDLLATSFLDINHESYKCISKLGLNCSLLAFCSAFALSFSSSPACVNILPYSLGQFGKLSLTLILQDLVERLSVLDTKVVTELRHFMSDFGAPVDYIQCRTKIDSSDHIDRASLLFYEFAVSSVLHVHQQLKSVEDEKDLHVLFMQGLQVLSDIIRRWMEIPFQIPRYFFLVRPCIGVELFVFNADSKKTYDLSISPGFHLSLNLCIQLKNAPVGRCIQLVKMYCILAARPSERLSSRSGEQRGQSRWQGQKIDETFELNNMLMHYIKSENKKNKRMPQAFTGGSDLVTAFVSFEPNGRGQAFSSCLLNVSSFPEGSYVIKWHSCCIDNKDVHWSLMPFNACSIFTIKKP